MLVHYKNTDPKPGSNLELWELQPMWLKKILFMFTRVHLMPANELYVPFWELIIYHYFPQSNRGEWNNPYKMFTKTNLKPPRSMNASQTESAWCCDHKYNCNLLTCV